MLANISQEVSTFNINRFPNSSACLTHISACQPMKNLIGFNTLYPRAYKLFLKFPYFISPDTVLNYSDNKIHQQMPIKLYFFDKYNLHSFDYV